MFHIGQRVVCIKQGPWVPLKYDERAPAYGGVYTIRFIGSYPEYGGILGLKFEEIVNPSLRYQMGFIECEFDAAHFRPVIKRKTDISVFQRMLVPAGKRELVDLKG